MQDLVARFTGWCEREVDPARWPAKRGLGQLLISEIVKAYGRSCVRRVSRGVEGLAIDG